MGVAQNRALNVGVEQRLSWRHFRNHPHPQPLPARGRGETRRLLFRGGLREDAGEAVRAARFTHPSVGMTNSAPARMPVGQRVVTVFSRV